MRNLSFSAYCFNEIWQVLYLSQDIKKTVFKPQFSYRCPWSSKAVPCCPPISHTIMDSSKLPENNNRFSGSQARARTLPGKKKWEKEIINKAKFLKPEFIQERPWVHSFGMIQIRNMTWDHSNHGASNSLKASSPGCSGGWVDKGRRACHHVSGIWIPPSIPLWLPVNCSVKQSERQSVRSGKSTNVNKINIEQHVPKLRVMTSLLISSPPMSILHWLFRCRYSNSRDVIASSPSFSCPTVRASQRDSLQVIHQMNWWIISQGGFVGSFDILWSESSRIGSLILIWIIQVEHNLL